MGYLIEMAVILYLLLKENENRPLAFCQMDYRYTPENK